MTQKALTGTLKVKQPAIARMERRADMYVSNLRGLIEAMGGRLRIIAEFPEGEVAITNFSEMGEGEEDKNVSRKAASRDECRSRESKSRDFHIRAPR